LNPTDLYDQKKLGSVVQHLKEKYPKSQLLGVGVEYGANLIVNFAANNPKMF
jgi:predicted alpha/beta-fold hydrolase